jgi:hypothetical protein
MDVRFGTWNIRSLYRSGSMKTVQAVQQYKLNVVPVKDVVWDRGGVSQQTYILF